MLQPVTAVLLYGSLTSTAEPQAAQPPPWHASAAYLYVAAPRQAGSWPGSTCDATPATGSAGCAIIAGTLTHECSATAGASALLEDPALDAREAHAGHGSTPVLTPCRVVPDDNPLSPMATPSSSGACPAASALQHDGQGLVLDRALAQVPCHALWRWHPSLQDGMAVRLCHARLPRAPRALPRHGGRSGSAGRR